MTVQTETPPASAPEGTAPQAPAQPAAPAPAPPAQQAPPAPVPAPPQQAREPDGRYAPAQPQAPAQQAPAAPADGTDWKAEAEKARAEAARLKTEAEQWKAQSRRQETRSKQNHQELLQRDTVLRQVAEKLGIEFDDRPDPDVLQQRLDAQTALARQRAVELAIYHQAAGAQGLNAAALLDSREFMARTALLDPEAADFPSSVAALVAEAAGQPRYQFQQAPTAQVQQQAPAPVQQAPAAPPQPQPPAPSSGADFSGAPGPGALWTQADYDNYMAGASVHDRDGSKLMKAIGDGLLVNLGIGRPPQRSRR